MYNWRMSQGLARERVDNLISDLSKNDTLSIIDEVQNTFTNSNEAIVGSGDTSMLPAHYKYREIVVKIADIINKGGLQPITLKLAGDMSKKKITKAIKDRTEAGYYKDASDMVHLTPAAIDKIRTAVRENYLLDGEIRSLVQGLVTEGNVGFAGRKVVVANKFSGLEPDLIQNDAALMYASAYKEAVRRATAKRSKDWEPEIDFLNSRVGSKTDMSTDALRVITEIGGRKTTLSGTLEPYAETLALLTGLRGGNLMDRVGSRLQLIDAGAEGEMILMSGGKPKGKLKAREAKKTGDPLFDGARIAIEIATKQEKGVIFLVSSENVNKVRNEIIRLVRENPEKYADLESFDSSITKADRLKLNLKVSRHPVKGEVRDDVFENGKILLLTEHSFEGLNVRDGVDLIFAEPHKFDLTQTLQAMRRINRNEDLPPDTVHLLYGRDTLNSFLKENAPLVKTLKARWAEKK